MNKENMRNNKKKIKVYYEKKYKNSFKDILEVDITQEIMIKK